jgi:polyvinyl alcohol dehydrogenase (cytochrome)
VSVTEAVFRAVGYEGRLREIGFRAAGRPRLRRRRRRQAAAAAVGLSLVIGPLVGAGSAAAAPGTPAARPAPVAAAPVAAAPVAAAPHAGSGMGEWPMAGANASNTRYQPDETVIGPGNVGGLVPKWTFRTAPGSGVWATPTEEGGVVYFPDSKGYLYAVDAATGHQIWSDYLPAIAPGLPATTLSRTSPVVDGGELILGDQQPEYTTGSGAHLLAVSRYTGKLIWITTVDAHPAAIMTGAPVLSGNVVYTGVSSNEESLETNPLYPCCTFRGSVAALDAQTGRLLWKTYTIPPNGGMAGGYSGGAVWGSTPVVDPATHLLYVGTGTNYTVPAGVCETPTQTGCTPPAPGDHLDSVLALDLATGAIRWAKRTEAADVWLPLNPAGPDYDFGSGPNLLNATAGGRPRQLLGIGQKSGVYWALDPVTGAVVWHTQVGPGSIMGGMQWGSATDGKRIYVAIGDLTDTPYRLGGSGPYAGETIAGGSWGALDASTGNILWQTPDPQGAIDIGFVSTANGVVYAGSDAGTGNNMYALDGGTGQIRWSFASGGSVVSGPAILNGVLFWGSGYWWGTENNAVYAFSLR